MVLAALEALAPDDVEFLSAETDIPAAGETRIGNLTLTFRVLQLT
jgi:hypothetical protein